MGSDGGLEEWAAGSGRRRPGGWSHGYLRFAFYGRVSTEDWQDPASSLTRQREQAWALVRGHGSIVAEFFDVGQSRSVAWARRPQAAALVAQLADPGRGWEAIVIGEYERAFYGGQYALMARLFDHYGVQLWLSEDLVIVEPVDAAGRPVPAGVLSDKGLPHQPGQPGPAARPLRAHRPGVLPQRRLSVWHRVHAYRRSARAA